MGCSRPLIFSFSSHKEEEEKLPHKKKGGKGGSHPLPPPRDLDFPPFRRGRGAQTFGFASFTRSSSPSGPLRAEPLEPTTPLILNGESEGIFLFVIK